MPRYIDAEALLEELRSLQVTVTGIRAGKNYLSTIVREYQKSVLKIVHEQPTANVVPKSEVDKLIGKFECFLCHVTGSRLSKHTYDLRTMETVANDCINETYNDGYGEGYKECAREIFEEIDKLHIHVSSIYDAKRYAKLKKKYTEGKDEQASIQTDHKEEFKK